MTRFDSTPRHWWEVANDPHEPTIVTELRARVAFWRSAFLASFIIFNIAFAIAYWS